MEELAVLAEIEHTELLKAVPTAYEAGIWRYCFYAAGKLLPFMADTFTRKQIIVSNVIINQIEYTEVGTLEELRTTLSVEDGGWVNGGSVVYVKYPYYNPQYLFYSLRYGTLIGFTDTSPVLIEGRIYRSGLINAPKIEQSADVFTYDKMKFNSATISIENTNGQFDGISDMFGNEFNLRVGAASNSTEKQKSNLIKLVELSENKRQVLLKKTDEYITLIEAKENTAPTLDDYFMLAQYYISNISVSLDKATFHLKDKRERLSAKIPDRQFTKEEYPFIDDNLIDKDMQETYGHCFGIPGICLQGKQIYASGSGSPMLNQYRFRFSSVITRVDKIQVKMASGKLPVDTNDPMGAQRDVDGWTTVFQRVKPNDGLADDWPGPYPRWKPGIAVGDLSPHLLAIGEITLSMEVSKQGGNRENSTNEVRMDGLFIDKSIPLEIIKDILYKYSNIPFDNRRYNVAEISTELELLNHEIGILFNKSISVYEAIEQLQSGCVLGFQFCVRENKFTARLDDPNRAEGQAIHALEIQNLGEVEIDWNADLYGSYTDIEYAYNYSEKAGRHYIDKARRLDILDIHRVEKEWPAHTLLANINDAEKRSDVLLDDFIKLRPLIKNIKLLGEKWLGLRIYDIRHIDFSICGEERDKLPTMRVKLIEDIGRMVTMRRRTDEYVIMASDEKEVSGGREFAGANVRCQILRVEFDAQTGITTIDVRARDRRGEWVA